MTRKGFTLIELLAVILIMAILTAVAVPQYKKSLERSRVAEALQMLPSVFDSRDRLITERQYTWPEPVTELPEWADRVTFPKLDIEMRGSLEPGAEPEGHYWRTGNFIYGVFGVPGGTAEQIPYVSAQFTRGTYSGLTLFYNGEDMKCCPSLEQCEELNLPFDPGFCS